MASAYFSGGQKLRQWVILDVDGVILDTQEANIRAFREGFRLRGLPMPSRRDVVRKIGWDPLDAMIALGCRDLAQAREVYELGVQPAYLKLINHHAKVFPGVRQALKKLLRRGLVIALCTSGYRKIQLRALRAARILSLVSVIRTAEDARYARNDPRFYRHMLAHLAGSVVCYVDDSGSSLDAARSVGLRVRPAGRKRYTTAERDRSAEIAQELSNFLAFR